MLQFRAAKFHDLERIMEIIKQAQSYFKEQGIDQWQNGYPNPTVIKQDIKKKESYVLTKNEKIIAVAVISYEEEPTYRKIFNGKWRSQQKYAVMHRVAVDSSFKGGALPLSLFLILNACVKKIKSQVLELILMKIINPCKNY